MLYWLPHLGYESTNLPFHSAAFYATFKCSTQWGSLTSVAATCFMTDVEIQCRRRFFRHLKCLLTRKFIHGGLNTKSHGLKRDFILVAMFGYVWKEVEKLLPPNPHWAVDDISEESNKGVFLTVWTRKQQVNLSSFVSFTSYKPPSNRVYLQPSKRYCLPAQNEKSLRRRWRLENNWVTATYTVSAQLSVYCSLCWNTFAFFLQRHNRIPWEIKDFLIESLHLVSSNSWTATFTAGSQGATSLSVSEQWLCIQVFLMRRRGRVHTCANRKLTHSPFVSITALWTSSANGIFAPTRHGRLRSLSSVSSPAEYQINILHKVCFLLRGMLR